MTITLTSLNEQLVKQNDTLGDVRSHIKAMLKIDQDQLQSMKDARGDELVAERQAQRASKPVKSASRPMGFGSGFMEGLGVTPVRQFMANALGSMFGGALAGSIGMMAGNLIKKGSIAALVYNFADDAIIAGFKLLEDQGIDFDFTEDQKKKIADRASSGLSAYIFAGLVTKNPYVKLATAIATAYSDKVFEGIKLMFGIKTDDKTGKAIVNLPGGYGDIDLNNPTLQDSLTGIGTAMTLVAVGLLNRLRKFITGAKIPLPDDTEINNKFRFGFGKGRGSVVEAKGARAAHLESLKPKGPSVRRVTKLDVERGLSTKSGAPAKVGQMTKLNTQSNLDGVGKGAEFAGKPWYRRMKNFNKLAKGLGVIGTAIDAYRINEIMNDDKLTDDEKGNQIISIIAGLGLGIAGGALAGAALGTVTGPWGTLFGGLAGGSLMAMGGEALVYRALSDYVMGKDNVNQYEKMAAEYSKLIGPNGQPIPGYQFGAGGIEKIRGASGGYEYMMDPRLSYPNAAPAGFGTSAAIDTLSTPTQRYHGVGSGRVGRGFVSMGDELSALDAIAHQREVMRENNYIGQVGDTNNTVHNSGSVVYQQSTPTVDVHNGGSSFSAIGN
tara:strand:+ start:257 stop:2083 length:1827 start_codon:yes stop_codon:yes gene_type:complete